MRYHAMMRLPWSHTTFEGVGAPRHRKKQQGRCGIAPAAFSHIQFAVLSVRQPNHLVTQLADGGTMGDEQHGLFGMGSEETLVEFTFGELIE